MAMQLLDRIEKRRFVGREFLLWLWFESEVFEATLATKEHGDFGLWIEKQMVLSAGKEATRIKGATPSASREPKESLLRGKLPESAGIHLSMGEKEMTFTLKAEQLAVAGLSLPTVLSAQEQEEEAARTALLDEPGGGRGKPRGRGTGKGREAVSDEAHEAFYERMHLTRDFESVVAELYRDFLALRLGAAWGAVVAPALAQWARGEEVDGDDYRAARDKALGPRRPKR